MDTVVPNIIFIFSQKREKRGIDGGKMGEGGYCEPQL